MSELEEAEVKLGENATAGNDWYGYLLIRIVHHARAVAIRSKALVDRLVAIEARMTDLEAQATADRDALAALEVRVKTLEDAKCPNP